MTHPAIARDFQDKFNLGDRGYNRASSRTKAVNYLNKIQDREHPSRRVKARVNIVVIIIIAIISMAVILTSVL